MAETCSGFSGLCPADAFAEGTACDDGDPCTVGDLCHEKTCAGQVPAPGPVCRTAKRATLALSRPAKASRRTLTWRWTGAAAVGRADFGDPTTTTAVGFCLLSGTEPVARLAVAAGGHWKARKKTFAYRDRARAAAGVGQILLMSGAAGKAKIVVAAGGAGLDVPLPLTLPLTARLQRADGVACWESPLAVTKNDARRLKAHSPSAK